MNEKLPPQIFDADAVTRAQTRARRRGVESFLVPEVMDGLSHRLGAVSRRFRNALIVGKENKVLEKYADNWATGDFDATERLKGADAGGFDLVVSVLSLHRINDVPGALIQMRRALKPDGFLLAATFGGDTLHELRESLTVGEASVCGGASPHVYPFADVRDLGGLLQRAGLALPVADSERTHVLYRDIFALARDLRDLGETNALVARASNGISRATLAAALDHYRSHHAEGDGRFRVTFDIVYLAGWAPHESQPKPLKPGSAKMRLADALKTEEKKL